MKKLFIGIILSIILILCFYDVQAESEQVENEVQPQTEQTTGSTGWENAKVSIEPEDEYRK